MSYFIRFTKSIFVLFVIAVGSICIISSGGGGGGESDNGNDSTVNVPKVTLEKESGTAGSIVKVSGIDIETCPLGSSEIRVGNEIAPALLNDKGETVIMLPLYYDEETKWPNPPTGPQNVKIYCNDKLLATLPDAMTITDLHPAPGTTALLIADYSELISDFEEIVAVVTPVVGLQQQLFDALIFAMQELVDGNSGNSLSTMINEVRQEDPDFLALIDAIHAASGAYQNIHSFKKLMTDLKNDLNATASIFFDKEAKALTRYETTSQIIPFTSAGATMSANNSVDKRIALPDESLAAQMQLYSTLDLFADQVISDTKTTFGLIFGALGIALNKIPAKKTVDVILHILDYSFKHLLVSILPATLEPISLSLPKSELENSEVTNAVIYVNAINLPAPVTLTDITDNILFILGIAGGGNDQRLG